MTQTPREIVTRAIKFENPERIPRHLWVLPWAEKEYPQQLEQLNINHADDIVSAPNVYRPSPLVKGDPYEIGTYTDEWGCVFENIHFGIIGEVRDPILKDIKDYKNVNVPYETLPNNEQQAIDTVNRFCDETDKFVNAACCPRPWERYQFIRGTANAMMDIAMPTAESKALLKSIHKFYLKDLEFWAKTNVDSLMFMDDWGSQQSLLINPVQWREIFKPLYKDYCNTAKANNKFSFMHSDGNIQSIYSDLIEIGLDVINSQLFIMDMEELSKIAKGKITFWGEIDRQHVLVNKDPKVTRDAVRKVASHLYDPTGGIIAQFEFGPGVQPENPNLVFEEWQKISERQ
jgi:uroporphyrinogen decarboxylase